MPDPTSKPTPPPWDDNDAAEWLADRLIELAIQNPGPIRFTVLQMAGLLPNCLPGVGLSERVVAKGMGMSRRKVRAIEAKALTHLRRTIQSNKPQP